LRVCLEKVQAVDGRVSLLFAGDFAPSGDFEAIVLRDRAKVFGDLLDDLASADLAFLNLETPLCDKGERIQKVGPHFRANPACLDAVAEGGFAIVGLANNHILDYGEEGLAQTLEACLQRGLQTCGAGENLGKARQPVVMEVGGGGLLLLRLRSMNSV
jgi:poly-gamma-glutamate capsule biosynthesis protein CapA/YwtB (metallophosphatase superfamily)